MLLEVGKTAIAQLRENWDVPRPVPRPVPPPVTPTQPALRGRPKKIVTAMPPSLLAPNDVTALFGAVKSFTVSYTELTALGRVMPSALHPVMQSYTLLH